MPLSQLPTLLSVWLTDVTAALDRRSAPRLLLLFVGALFAKGRATVTSWFRCCWHHRSASRIGSALALLAGYRLAYAEQVSTRGRPEERWGTLRNLLRAAKKAKYAKKVHPPSRVLVSFFAFFAFFAPD